MESQETREPTEHTPLVPRNPNLLPTSGDVSILWSARGSARKTHYLWEANIADRSPNQGRSGVGRNKGQGRLIREMPVHPSCRVELLWWRRFDGITGTNLAPTMPLRGPKSIKLQVREGRIKC